MRRSSRCIAAFFLAGVLAPALSPAAEAPLPPEPLAAKLDAYLEAAARVKHFSGSVLVVREGATLLRKGYGLANIELGVPNTPATVFRIGSITKAFTSTAVLMLQERGKLSIDDAACKYLASCPPAWQPITLRHLLTHTAGVPDRTSGAVAAAEFRQPASPGELVSRAQASPLDFAPGERGKYSNAGYMVLGMVIERASGMPYAEFIRTQIFAPAGMTRSGYEEAGRLVKDRASGYAWRDGDWRAAPYFDMSNAYAAGALYSTVDDLRAFDEALEGGRLLSTRTLEAMYSPSREVLPGIRYALGWGRGTVAGHPAILHAGNTSGFSTMIARFPAERTTVIVLGNDMDADAVTIASDLATIAFGKPVAIPRERRTAEIARERLERYAGAYRLAPSPLFPPDSVITLVAGEGKLVRQVNGGTRADWWPESETDFFQAVPEIDIRFALDAGGRITGFTWTRAGMAVRATRELP